MLVSRIRRQSPQLWSPSSREVSGQSWPRKMAHCLFDPKETHERLQSYFTWAHEPEIDMDVFFGGSALFKEDVALQRNVALLLAFAGLEQLVSWGMDIVAVLIDDQTRKSSIVGRNKLNINRSQFKDNLMQGSTQPKLGAFIEIRNDSWGTLEVEFKFLIQIKLKAVLRGCSFENIV